MLILVLFSDNNYVSGILNNYLYKIDKNTYFGKLSIRVRDEIVDKILIKNKISFYLFYENKQKETGFDIISNNVDDLDFYNIFLSRH